MTDIKLIKLADGRIKMIFQSPAAIEHAQNIVGVNLSTDEEFPYELHEAFAYGVLIAWINHFYYTFTEETEKKLNSFDVLLKDEGDFTTVTLCSEKALVIAEVLTDVVVDMENSAMGVLTIGTIPTDSLKKVMEKLELNKLTYLEF